MHISRFRSPWTSETIVARAKPYSSQFIKRLIIVFYRQNIIIKCPVSNVIGAADHLKRLINNGSYWSIRQSEANCCSLFFFELLSMVLLTQTFHRCRHYCNTSPVGWRSSSNIGSARSVCVQRTLFSENMALCIHRFFLQMPGNHTADRDNIQHRGSTKRTKQNGPLIDPCNVTTAIGSGFSQKPTVQV